MHLRATAGNLAGNHLFEKAHNMDKIPLFQQFEREVEAEAREWKKRRLEEKIAQLALEKGEISPPQPKARDEKTTDEH